MGTPHKTRKSLLVNWRGAIPETETASLSALIGRHCGWQLWIGMGGRIGPEYADMGDRQQRGLPAPLSARRSLRFKWLKADK